MIIVKKWCQASGGKEQYRNMQYIQLQITTSEAKEIARSFLDIVLNDDSVISKNKQLPAVKYARSRETH